MTTYTPAQAALIAEAVLRMKRELLHPIITGVPYAAKVIPLNLQGFAQLHDYCDANCIGGMCEPATIARFNAAFANKPIAQGVQADSLINEGAMDAINAIQHTLHDWIAFGGMARDAAACARMTDEQLSCMFDDTRAGEAYGMVQDLDARVSLWPHGSDEMLRVTELLTTIARDLPDEYSDLDKARDTAENFAEVEDAVLIVGVATEDRRPAYMVRVYEGPRAEELAREADDDYGLWIDGVEVQENPHYRVTWGAGYEPREPEEHSGAWFTQDRGFSGHDRMTIRALHVGDSYRADDMNECNVTRIY